MRPAAPAYVCCVGSSGGAEFAVSSTALAICSRGMVSFASPAAAMLVALSRQITIDMLLTWVSPALSKIGVAYIPVV